jgi:hypothetical protein
MFGAFVGNQLYKLIHSSVGGEIRSIVTRVRLLQPENALQPILVTLAGIVMLVKPVRSENAQPTILVTPLGMVMLPLIPNGTISISVIALL